MPETDGTTTPMMFLLSTSTSGEDELAIAADLTFNPPSIALAKSIRDFANTYDAVSSFLAFIISERSVLNSWNRPSRFIFSNLYPFFVCFILRLRLINSLRVGLISRAILVPPNQLQNFNHGCQDDISQSISDPNGLDIWCQSQTSRSNTNPESHL